MPMPKIKLNFIPDARGILPIPSVEDVIRQKRDMEWRAYLSSPEAVELVATTLICNRLKGISVSKEEMNRLVDEAKEAAQAILKALSGGE